MVDALRDDPEDPQFIQTAIGIGYRFIAPVTRIEAAQTEEPPVGQVPESVRPVVPEIATKQDRGPRTRPGWLRVGVLVLLVAAIAVVGLSLAAATGTSGAGSPDCRSLYGSARRRSLSGLFSRRIENRFLVEW